MHLNSWASSITGSTRAARSAGRVWLGDHRHVGPGEAEQPYAFTTVEQLRKDFLAECELLGWSKGDEANSR